MFIIEHEKSNKDQLMNLQRKKGWINESKMTDISVNIQFNNCAFYHVESFFLLKMGFGVRVYCWFLTVARLAVACRQPQC